MTKTNPTEPTATKRDDFSPKIKETLARRAGYRCSICKEPTVGPHSNPDKAAFLGEASHIHSAAPNGPRANNCLSPEERASASNGIHLCKKHARLVDVDEEQYTAEKLRQIKNNHEQEIRSMLAGQSHDYDRDFLNSHETQLIHGRGNPTLADLWVSRHLIQPEVGTTPIKHDVAQINTSESGIYLITSDQTTGRTSLLKRMVSEALGRLHCVWLDGRNISESIVKDPVKALAEGYSTINPNADGWQLFLEADREQNRIFIDNLHLSPLNIATKRKFLSVLQGLASSIIVTASEPFQLELLAISPHDGLRFHQWRLLDLSRTECADLVKLWCRYKSETISDYELDFRISSTCEQLEVLFGKKLMPRHPFFVLTALQSIDAGTPMDTAVGSFGGVYETVIHLAISRNAPNQAAISNERAYLQELAYWCEFLPANSNRSKFNKWFSELKGIDPKRATDLERSLATKGFLSRKHKGFRFNYQNYYFLACYLRDHANKTEVHDYISKLILNCWNEDYANTALFLAYLHPSSFLVTALLNEVNRLFADQKEFDAKTWSVDVRFPDGFFKGLTFTTDPEVNRKVLAERLDDLDPVGSAECEIEAANPPTNEDDKRFLEFLKSFHLIKLIGQLIRNSPIAFDAEQKQKLLGSGFNLCLRIVTFMGVVCNHESLQAQALNELRERVLKKSDRTQIEAKLTGLIYNLTVFLAFSPLRHACHYLAHPELGLIYDSILKPEAPKGEGLSQKILSCGVNFELRTPDSDFLRSTYKELTPAGQDILHMWTWLFLSFNRVPVSKRQALLDSVEMSQCTQLLLPKGS